MKVFGGWVPAERHTHHAPDGSVTGYTTVIREAEWDPYTQAEAVASLEGDQLRCRECGVDGALVEERQQNRWVSWDGVDYEVVVFRCQACASEATVRRDYEKSHEHVKPAAGRAHPTDGIRFAVQERVRQTKGVGGGYTP